MAITHLRVVAVTSEAGMAAAGGGDRGQFQATLADGI